MEPGVWTSGVQATSAIRLTSDAKPSATQSAAFARLRRRTADASRRARPRYFFADLRPAARSSISRHQVMGLVSAAVAARKIALFSAFVRVIFTSTMRRSFAAFGGLPILMGQSVPQRNEQSRAGDSSWGQENAKIARQAWKLSSPASGLLPASDSSFARFRRGWGRLTGRGSLAIEARSETLTGLIEVRIFEPRPGLRVAEHTAAVLCAIRLRVNGKLAACPTLGVLRGGWKRPP
jgi:hypothetical protein